MFLRLINVWNRKGKYNMMTLHGHLDYVIQVAISGDRNTGGLATGTKNPNS